MPIVSPSVCIEHMLLQISCQYETQCAPHSLSQLSSLLFFFSSLLACDMCWACAPKSRCHGSYMMSFSCYRTRSSSEGPAGVYLCLAHFEALDPPSCLPFGAHCVMEEVTGRAASQAAPPSPLHSY